MQKYQQVLKCMVISILKYTTIKYGQLKQVILFGDRSAEVSIEPSFSHIGAVLQKRKGDILHFSC